MARKIFGQGLPVLVLAVGMIIAGCDNGTTDNNSSNNSNTENPDGDKPANPSDFVGWWETTNGTVLMTFRSHGTWGYSISGSSSSEGTYTKPTSDSKMALLVTTGTGSQGRADISGNTLTVTWFKTTVSEEITWTLKWLGLTLQ